MNNCALNVRGFSFIAPRYRLPRIRIDLCFWYPTRSPVIIIHCYFEVLCRIRVLLLALLLLALV